MAGLGLLNRQTIGRVQGLVRAASITLGCLVVVTGLGVTGVYQALEFTIIDHFFRLRPFEEREPRIVIVSIDEADLQQLKQWPLPDAQLARLLQIINDSQPRVIGLDIYRDLPVQPGQQDLEQVFANFDTIIGVEKISETAVNPPPILKARGQVGFADLPLDSDSSVRRALISIDQNNDLKLSLSTSLALRYLEHEGVSPISLDESGMLVQLGQTRISPLTAHWGAYVRLDNKGYQTFINFRKAKDGFASISITDVLNKDFSADLFEDRVVLIGATAPSLNDVFPTPLYHQSKIGTLRTPGVIIHAHIVSQLVSAALEDRSLTRSFPEVFEWSWSCFWIGLGTLIPILTIQDGRGKTKFASAKAISCITLLLGGQLLCGYLLFLIGWWMPLVPALLGLMMASTISLTSYNQELSEFAYIDTLTRIPNRRAFEEYFQKVRQQGRQIGIILCDVDYFKKYNDTYGHQAGDICLQKVAHALHTAVRKQDMAARYGGEEFVVILPDTSGKILFEVAERMRKQVCAMQLEHKASTVTNHVTISCGASSFLDNGKVSLKTLLEITDKALYEAKASGRNQVCLNKNFGLQTFN